MDAKSSSEILRGDKNLQLAGEKYLEQFKYMAGICWAPVVVVMAFFRGGETDFGWIIRLLLSGSMLGLMFAGSVFFLAYQKQTVMMSHFLMSDEAIERASSVNPFARKEIEGNERAAWALGHLADKYAFRTMIYSYLAIAVVAIFAVWQ